VDNDKRKVLPFIDSLPRNNFSGGEVETAINQSDTSVVKRANAKLFIPLKDIKENKADFKFYFGPNDYQTIGHVAEKFTKNVYLGWPPVFWINKFVIFPGIPFLNEIHYQLWIDHYHPRDLAQACPVSFVVQVIPEYGKDESAEA
jgi:hypothetical protein